MVQRKVTHSINIRDRFMQFTVTLNGTQAREMERALINSWLALK